MVSIANISLFEYMLIAYLRNKKFSIKKKLAIFFFCMSTHQKRMVLTSACVSADVVFVVNSFGEKIG